MYVVYSNSCFHIRVSEYLLSDSCILIHEPGLASSFQELDIRDILRRVYDIPIRHLFSTLLFLYFIILCLTLDNLRFPSIL